MKVTKTRKIFEWADRVKHWTSKQTRFANSVSALTFRTTHTIWFCCQANSKAPKAGQVFPYATCNNHSFVILFVDWSSMKLMLQFGNFSCRGWCVVLSAVHKVFGCPKFPQASEWTNFPHATLVFRSMKRWQNHFDVNNLTHNYRRVKNRRKQWL